MQEAMRDSLNDWIALLELECTTCPETPKEARSECHAWSALPMYEMMRTMAGVVPERIGWEHVRIQPHTMDLEDLQGKVATPKGSISFWLGCPMQLPWTCRTRTGEELALLG